MRIMTWRVLDPGLAASWRARSHVQPSRGGGSWSRYFAAVVPDGYATAQIGDMLVPVSGNVAYFPTAPRQTLGVELVLRGEAGERRIRL